MAGRLPEHHDFVFVARPDLGGLVEREGTDGVSPCLDERDPRERDPAKDRLT